MLEIGLPTGVAFFRTRVELDGVTFLLDFAWNARLGQWLMSVYDAEAAPLVEGIGIASNWPLLRHHKWDTRMPAGELIATDLTETIEAPGYDELGTTVPLIYHTAAELA